MVILYQNKGKEAKRQRYKNMMITNNSFRTISDRKMAKIKAMGADFNADYIYIPYNGEIVYFDNYTTNTRTMKFMMDI
jgi:hypothetical protein